MAFPAMQELVDEAFKNDEFTDLTLKYNGLSIKTHKLVICKQSPVFKAMCLSGFKESETATIDLSHDTELDQLQFQCLIDFFYGFRYAFDPETKLPVYPRVVNASTNSTAQTSTTSSQALTKPGGLFGVPPTSKTTVTGLGSSLFGEPSRQSTSGSGVYGNSPNTGFGGGGLFGTAQPAQPMIQPTTDSLFGSVFRAPDPKPDPKPRMLADSRGFTLSLKFHAQMYAAADRYDIKRLADYAKSMYSISLQRSPIMSQFLESITLVYTSTPDSNRGLRDVAAKYLKNNIGKMKDIRTNVREIVMEVPAFAADVLDLLY